MKESDQRRLTEALAFALEAHGPQTRKGTEVPYVSHLLQVAGLVMEAGGDLTQAVAGLLHDTLEDCPDADVDKLVARFGPEVAALVEACSDLLPGDAPDAKSPWAERKEGFLEKIAGADPRAKLVCACDKLHNLRSLAAELRADGAATLERFNAEPAEILWYYESAHRTLGRVLPGALDSEYEAALQTLREFAPRSGPPGGRPG